jgi:hypothetical protein
MIVGKLLVNTYTPGDSKDESIKKIYTPVLVCVRAINLIFFSLSKA